MALRCVRPGLVALAGSRHSWDRGTDIVILAQAQVAARAINIMHMRLGL